MEMRAKPLIKGVLSFAVPALRSSHLASVTGTASARECYSIFLRHYSRLARFTGGRLPAHVAEIGPGHSIGTGLAALIAGSARYVGLDLQNHTDAALNLRLFDALVALFRERTPIPRETEIATEPLDWAFPAALEPGLAQALDPARLAAIRQDVSALSGAFVGFAAPWTSSEAVAAGSVEWIFSHSVMEHIDDLAETYRSCAAWLADGGMMTHEIDYSSHGLTRHWNGHWSIEPQVWRLIRGKRPFLINRAPHQVQRDLLTQTGFEIREDSRVKRKDGLPNNRFATACSVTEEDAATHISFMICQKNK